MIRNIPSRCTNPTPYIQLLTAPRSLVLHPIPRLSVFTHQSTHKLRTPNPSRFTSIAFTNPPDCRRFPPKRATFHSPFLSHQCFAAKEEIAGVGCSKLYHKSLYFRATQNYLHPPPWIFVSLIEPDQGAQIRTCY